MIQSYPIPPIQQLIDQYVLNKDFGRYIDLFEAGRNPVIQSEPNQADIERAIKNRQYVGVYYEDDSDGKVLKGFRLIEPYVYGKGYTHNGKLSHQDREYIRVFVVKDTKKDPNTEKWNSRRTSVSKSNKDVGWRLMRVDRIKSWSNLKRKFTRYREFYNPDDKMINNIIISADVDSFRGETTNKFTK